MAADLFGDINDERRRIRESAVQLSWGVVESTPGTEPGVDVSKSMVADAEKRFNPLEPRDLHGHWERMSLPGLPVQDQLRRTGKILQEEALTSGSKGHAVNSRYDTAGRDLRKAAKALDAGNHTAATEHLTSAVTHLSKAKVTTGRGRNAHGELHGMLRSITGDDHLDTMPDSTREAMRQYPRGSDVDISLSDAPWMHATVTGYSGGDVVVRTVRGRSHYVALGRVRLRPVDQLDPDEVEEDRRASKFVNDWIKYSRSTSDSSIVGTLGMDDIYRGVSNQTGMPVDEVEMRSKRHDKYEYAMQEADRRRKLESEAELASSKRPGQDPDALGPDDPYYDISTNRLIQAAQRVTPRTERGNWPSTEGSIYRDQDDGRYKVHVIDTRFSPDAFLNGDYEPREMREMLIEQMQHYGRSRSGIWRLFA